MLYSYPVTLFVKKRKKLCFIPISGFMIFRKLDKEKIC